MAQANAQILANLQQIMTTMQSIGDTLSQPANPNITTAT